MDATVKLKSRPIVNVNSSTISILNALSPKLRRLNVQGPPFENVPSAQNLSAMAK
jgi:hypothetical protein